MSGNELCTRMRDSRRCSLKVVFARHFKRTRDMRFSLHVGCKYGMKTSMWAVSNQSQEKSPSHP